MKIALLCNGLGVVHRGAEQFSLDFKKHITNHTINLYGAKDTHTKTRDTIKIPWRNGRAYLESYYFGKHLYNHDTLKDYDLIINNAGFPCSYWCNKIRKKHNIPFITRARGGGREEHLSAIFKPDQMVFLTKEHRDTINLRGKVIPNAIDLSEFYERPESPLVKNLERPIYLTTGAFVAFKRHKLIVEAFSNLNHGTLVMSGGGHLKPQIQTLCKQYNIQHKFTGMLEREDLLQLYQSSDVFVHASRKEAFGNVYLEAMSSGLPVVTEDDTRRRSIVGDAGIFVDCTDTHKFTCALQDILSLNTNPQQQAHKFSWSVMKRRWEKIIDETC